MPDPHTTEIQAAVLQKLIQHLQDAHHVQNIDLMNLAGFCRNCLSKWYVEAAKHQGHPVSLETARTIVYGMPYETWKHRYQSGPHITVPHKTP